MSTYATLAEFRTYTGWGTSVVSDADAQRALDFAERDLDRTAFPAGHNDPGEELKWTPGRLADSDAEALSRATCAQAAFRVSMGDPYFQLPKSGLGEASAGTREAIGPAAWAELEGTGLLRLWGRSTGRSPHLLHNQDD